MLQVRAVINPVITDPYAADMLINPVIDDLWNQDNQGQPISYHVITHTEETESSISSSPTNTVTTPSNHQPKCCMLGRAIFDPVIADAAVQQRLQSYTQSTHTEVADALHNLKHEASHDENCSQGEP
jgi:hypothetical protein